MSRSGADVNVFRPWYKDRKTSERKQQQIWVYTFTVQGVKLPNTSSGTKKKTLATAIAREHKKRLEEAYAGVSSTDEPSQRMRTVQAVCDEHLKQFQSKHSEQSRSEKTASTTKERLKHIKRLLSSILIADLTDKRMLGYINQRLDELAKRRDEEGQGHRTVNMEVDALSRAIGRPWRVLWPNVARLPENTDTGRALEEEEEKKLLYWAAQSRSPYLLTMLRIALLTGMRFGEISKLKWQQIDFDTCTLTLGRKRRRNDALPSRVKTKESVRTIPIHADLIHAFTEHAGFVAQKLGPIQSEWFAFPECNRRRPIDPYNQ